MFKSIVLFALLAANTEAIRLTHKSQHKAVKTNHFLKTKLAQAHQSPEDIMAMFDTDGDNEISIVEFNKGMTQIYEADGHEYTEAEQEEAM